MRTLLLAATFALAAHAASAAPTIAAPAPLTLAGNTSAPLTLSATDPNATAAQITYSFAGGAIELNGLPTSTVTQADITAGAVTFVAGSAAGSFSLGFTVTGAGGSSVGGTLPVTITAPAPVMPGEITLAPGVTLVPHADGTWGWK